MRGAGRYSASEVFGDVRGGSPDPLLDWSAWEQHGGTVKHPCVTFKPADIERAKANIQRYAWAKNYAAGVEQTAKRHLDRLTPEFLANMIPETTPGDPLWTPCPACREQGKPVHPHGLWTWNLDDADHLQCTMCRTVFPNDKYPEDVVLQTTVAQTADDHVLRRRDVRHLRLQDRPAQLHRQRPLAQGPVDRRLLPHAGRGALADRQARIRPRLPRRCSCGSRSVIRRGWSTSATANTPTWTRASRR